MLIIISSLDIGVHCTLNVPDIHDIRPHQSKGQRSLSLLPKYRFKLDKFFCVKVLNLLCTKLGRSWVPVCTVLHIMYTLHALIAL